MHPARREESRRGIVVLWVILAIPVFLVGLCIVMDYANLWVARSELEAALEAAAQAGVDAWAEESRADDHVDPDGPTVDAVGGVPLKTDVARRAAQAAAASNLVRGNPVQLDLNDGGPLAHDNAACDGDIVLGGYDDMAFTFVQSADVGCGRSTVTIIEAFLTINNPPMGSPEPLVQTANTFGDDDAFHISLYNTGGQAPFTGSVTQIIWDLRNPDSSFGIDDGVFQPFVGGAAIDANGFGPTVGGANEVAGVTFDVSNAANGILVINIPPGNFTTNPASNDLYFGIDTDGVDVGPPNIGDQDDGNDFGDAGAASASPGRVRFTLGFNGFPGNATTTVQSLQPQGPDNNPNSRARLQGNAFNLQGQIEFIQIIANEDFAVLAQDTIEVPSLWKTLFGLPVGPHRVSARSVAASKCRNQSPTDPEVLDPQLVHVPVGNVQCP